MLSPAGKIIRVLLDEKAKTSTQIINLTGLSKPAVYNNLKDLQLAGYVKERDGIYEVTKEGVRAFWSSVLDDELAGRLVRVAGGVGVSTYELVEVGVRLILDIVEYGTFSSEVRGVIERYDPALAEHLRSLVREEVVA